MHPTLADRFSTRACRLGGEHEATPGSNLVQSRSRHGDGCLADRQHMGAPIAGAAWKDSAQAPPSGFVGVEAVQQSFAQLQRSLSAGAGRFFDAE